MNAHAMLTKILSLVSFNMHKARQKALIACTQSLLAGNVATVTSMGRGICSKAFEKHRIKRADRLLSNQHLLSEVPSLYMAVSHLFTHTKHPVIAVDWSDLDDHKGRFLLRAAMAVKGRPVTLYQEVHCIKSKEKPTTHKQFLARLSSILPSQCHPIIVTDAGFKAPWFRQVLKLGWHVVRRLRKPHFYSLNQGQQWQCISKLFQQANIRPKRFDQAKIARHKPFECTLVLVSNKYRRFQANTSVKPALSLHSLGLRAIATRLVFTHAQWRRAMEWLYDKADAAWHGEA